MGSIAGMGGWLFTALLIILGIVGVVVALALFLALVAGIVVLIIFLVKKSKAKNEPQVEGIETEKAVEEASVEEINTSEEN
ncbi:MAG: hypothetical protein IJ437_01665 [Clostridia bacterium]|nr:hypothetical protein [Clostridia bacterium]